MPVSAPGKEALTSEIKAALLSARDSGSLDGASSDQVISNLASDLTSAIHSYVTTIIVTINPGILVTGSGFVGNTITPGSS